MKRSRLARTPVNFEVVLTSEGRSNRAFIANLSEGGAGVYLEADSEDTAIRFSAGTKLETNFQIPSGERIYLNCTVRWLHIHKIPSYGLTYSMGLEIIEPPLIYKDFTRTLTLTQCLL